jgi:hypothetical protein
MRNMNENQYFDSKNFTLSIFILNNFINNTLNYNTLQKATKNILNYNEVTLYDQTV